jgi:hypothetical protein
MIEYDHIVSNESLESIETLEMARDLHLGEDSSARGRNSRAGFGIRAFLHAGHEIEGIPLEPDEYVARSRIRPGPTD